MDSIWIIIVIALGVLAVAATVDALVRQRAPRVAADPELVARHRDRIEDLAARRRLAEREASIAHELEAPGNGLAPLQGRAVQAERVWAGAL